MSEAKSDHRPFDCEQETEWPMSIRTKVELDAALEKGARSGISSRTILDIDIPSPDTRNGNG